MKKYTKVAIAASLTLVTTGASYADMDGVSQSLSGFLLRYNLIQSPKAGRFVPVLGSGSPFTQVQFCPWVGGGILINGQIVTIPATTGCVSTATGLIGTYNNAYIESNGTISSGQTLSATTLYRVYAGFVSGNQLVMIFSTAAHVTHPIYGNEVMSGDLTKTLIGIVFTDGSSKFDGTNNVQYTASFFNKVRIALYVSTSNVSTNSTAWIEQNSGNRLQWVQWSDDVPSAESPCVVINNTAGAATSVAVALNTTTVPSLGIGAFQSSSANFEGNATSYTIGVTGASAEGQQFAAQLIEVSSNTGQITSCYMHTSPLPS